MAAIDATRLVQSAVQGDQRAIDELLPLVYDDLKNLAQHYLLNERPSHTLQPSALVHEAYLRLVDQDRLDWQGKTHFRAIAARMMHRVLLDHGKHRNRAKRGGGWNRLTLSGAGIGDGQPDTQLQVLTDALQRLRELDEQQHAVVELRYFGGLTMEEIAQDLGISKRTAEREWTMAKAWLQHELSKGDTS